MLAHLDVRERLAALLAATIAAFVVLALSSETVRASSPMVRTVNEFRVARDLPSLGYSRSLARTSGRWARQLARRGVLMHSSPRVQGTPFSRLGETLAYTNGHGLHRALVVRMWLGSPSHRALVLSRGFNRVGAGKARGRVNGRPVTFWVLHFGRVR